MTSASPAKKIPITTQHMWEVACEDYEIEQARLAMIRAQPDVTPEAITHAERRLRMRQAICNAVDFLITNKDDIGQVMASRGRNR